MLSRLGLVTLLGFAVGGALQVLALTVLIGHMGAQPAVSAGDFSLVGVMLATAGYVMPRLIRADFTREEMARAAGIGFVCAVPAVTAFSWAHAIFLAVFGIALLVTSRILRGL